MTEQLDPRAAGVRLTEALTDLARTGLAPQFCQGLQEAAERCVELGLPVAADAHLAYAALAQAIDHRENGSSSDG